MSPETGNRPTPLRLDSGRLPPGPPPSRSPGDLDVQTIDSSAGLRALKQEWTDLVEAGSCDPVFLSWDWLATWWSVLGEGDLVIGCVRRDGRLIGLAPLHRPPALQTSGGAWALAATPTLRLLGVGQVGSDHLDFPCLPGQESAVAEVLAAWLDERGEIVELEQQSAREGSVSALLAEALGAQGWQGTVRESHVCPYATLEGADWESFVSGLGRSHRQNLRRRLRKIEDAFDVHLETARRGPDIDRALDVLFDLHDLRWKPRGGSDAFSDPGIRRFHRTFLQRAAARDLARLYVLWLDGEPAAALYGLFDGERFLFYQSGFDPEYSRHSVGLVLMGMTFRAAIEEGALEYDLLHGDERYKRHWSDASRPLLRRELFPPSLSGRFRHGLRKLEREARGRLRELRTTDGGDGS